MPPYWDAFIPDPIDSLHPLLVTTCTCQSAKSERDYHSPRRAGFKTVGAPVQDI